MALKETAGLYETLKSEWNKKNPNLNKCGEILSKLKVERLIDLSVFHFRRWTSNSIRKALAILASLLIFANDANFVISFLIFLFA